MDSTILVLGEMTGGMLLACVPTLGPLFFPDRTQSSLRNNQVHQSLETIGSKSRKRKALRPSLVDSLFASKADTQVDVDEHGEELPLRHEGISYQQRNTISSSTR